MPEGQSLVARALSFSQAYALKIFPVGDDKRPLVRWKEAASSDPDDIEEMFAMDGAAGIGVPCGPDNDLIVYDVDRGHTSDPEALAKLDAWMTKWQDAINQDGCCRLTQSGGYHLIFLHPEVSKSWKPPRRIMPYLDVIYDGFYFIYHMEGRAYHDHPANRNSINDIGEPPMDMFAVVERAAGVESGNLMSTKAAWEALKSDGEAGTRHDALLRVTKDFVDEQLHQDPSIGILSIAARCVELLEEELEGLVDSKRLAELIEWDWRSTHDNRVELTGELGRAIQGAYNKSSAGALKSMADRLVERGAQPAATGNTLEPRQRPRYEKLTGSIFRDYVRNEGVHLQPWVIEHICRRGDLGGIVGIPGLGKTNLTAAWIAGLISGNGQAVGLPRIPDAVGVAWANPEEPIEALKLRLDAALDAANLEPSKPVVLAGIEELVGGAADFLWRDGRDMMINEDVVRAWCEELIDSGIEVLMLDPITEFNSGNENDRGDRRLLVQAIRSIASALGLTVIYWAHTAQRPEGKRDDWYADDLFAERGSSGGIASNQFGATLVREIPAGYKAQQSVEWSKAASDPSDPTPNLLRMTVLKSKLGMAKPVLRWHLTTSDKRYGDDHMPVTLPIDEAQALRMISQRAAQNDDLVRIPMARGIIDAHGEGVTDTLPAAHDMMTKAAVPGWPTQKTLRIDEGAGKALMELWRRPVVLSHKGCEWTVSMVVIKEGKKSRFALTVSKEA